MLIRHEEGHFPVMMMCRLMHVSRAAYYRWKARTATGPAPDSRAARRLSLAARIVQIWVDSRKTYGVRRVRAELAAQGESVSLWLVWKLMQAQGIYGVQPRSGVRTTVQAADIPERRDFLGRRFTPPVPTTHLVGDITYLKTGEGWLYLATVIDLCTRMVVGWQTASHMRTELVIDALAMAHNAGYVAGGAIFHSDRGSVYTSAAFAHIAKLLDVRLSVGKTGVCWDNAVAESFFASLKNEMYHRTTHQNRARARLAVADYIEVFYNRQRRHSTINYQTPATVMASFFSRNTPLALAA